MKKKNKLYTANKWNQPLFAQGIDRVHQNIFDGLLSSSIQNIGTTSVLGNPTKIDLGKIGAMKTPSQGLGLGIKNIAKSGIGVVGGAVGTIGNKIISGGLSSGAGNAIGSIGGTVGGALSAVNPVVGGIVSAASGIIGGLTNRAFGSKLNQEKISEVNNSNKALNTLSVDNSSVDSIMNQWGNQDFGKDFSKSDIGKDGWFSNKAKKKYRELQKQQDIARNRALTSYDNSIDAADTQADLNALANFAAFGGPLDGLSSLGTGAIDYGFMSDYLVAKNKSAETKNKISTNVFGNLPVTPLSTFALGGGIHIKKSHRGLFTKEAKEHGMGVQEFASHVLANKDKYSPEVVKRANFARNATKFALGGDMQTNGSDFSNGLLHIDAGGSHES